MKGNILVLDDNTMDVKITSAHLSRLGFSVGGFVKPQEALFWLDQNPVQLILLDLSMPDIDGFEMIKNFRKDPRWSAVPIIIISGNNEVEGIKRAVGLGASDYIVKPIDPLVLEEKTMKLLSKGMDFNSVQFSQELVQAVYFKSSLKIVEVSEFGMKIESHHDLAVNSTTEIGGLDVAFFGVSEMIVRCLSIERLENQRFSIQLTFVGLKERERQILRQSCRQLWIQNKSKTQAA